MSLLQTKPDIWLTNITESSNVPISIDIAGQVNSQDKHKHNKHKHARTTQLTLALTDPDAPSAEDPEWGQICHWISTNIKLNTTKSSLDSAVSSLNKDSETDTTNASISKKKNKQHHKDKKSKKHHKNRKNKKHHKCGPHDLVEYKPPGPPPKTGKHRYIFLALAPLNGTTERLHLAAPADRKHWGYGEQGRGVREWMGEQGLGVVGANFIYAENEEQ